MKDSVPHKQRDSRLTPFLLELSDGAHYVLIDNNVAGQGLQLARSLSKTLIGRAAIIYRRSLPEQREYEEVGDTIQHNELNYHDP